jgi:hypothetical protein
MRRLVTTDLSDLGELSLRLAARRSHPHWVHAACSSSLPLLQRGQVIIKYLASRRLPALAIATLGRHQVSLFSPVYFTVHSQFDSNLRQPSSCTFTRAGYNRTGPKPSFLRGTHS